MKGFCIALQFLTRIPLPNGQDYDAHSISRSVLFYPVVGLLIGLVLTVLAWILTDSPTFVAAGVVLTVWVALTGALHLDGLGDCCDAWIGGFGDQQRTLAIMKDPASGPMAVSALVLTLLLKWAALTVILEEARVEALLLVPVLGRTAMVALMLSTPYVSPHGLGEALLRHLSMRAAWSIIATSMLCLPWMLGTASTIAALAVMLCVRHATLQRLGGATGDVYGATLELSETAALLAIAL